LRGGSAPAAQLPTTLITVTSTQLSAATLEEQLRLHTPPIIARIINDQLAFDLRTVTTTDENVLLAALTTLAVF
jgi:L-seryl-tRNA(Ser) seleniumtransferase